MSEVDGRSDLRGELPFSHRAQQGSHGGRIVPKNKSESCRWGAVGCRGATRGQIIGSNLEEWEQIGDAQLVLGFPWRCTGGVGAIGTGRGALSNGLRIRRQAQGHGGVRPVRVGRSSALRGHGLLLSGRRGPDEAGRGTPLRETLARGAELAARCGRLLGDAIPRA